MIALFKIAKSLSIRPEHTDLMTVEWPRDSAKPRLGENTFPALPQLRWGELLLLSRTQICIRREPHFARRGSFTTTPLLFRKTEFASWPNRSIQRIERSVTKWHYNAIDGCIQWLETIEAFAKRQMQIALLCILKLANTNRSIERLLARE